jgi:hypothetical protein
MVISKGSECHCSDSTYVRISWGGKSVIERVSIRGDQI